MAPTHAKICRQDACGYHRNVTEAATNCSAPEGRGSCWEDHQSLWDLDCVTPDLYDFVPLTIPCQQMPVPGLRVWLYLAAGVSLGWVQDWG